LTTSAQPEGRQTRELDQQDWGSFFEGINRRLEAGDTIETTIELVSEAIVGPEAVRLPLDSITYEDGDDEIAIGVGGRTTRFPAVLWHFVQGPRQVWVMDNDEQPTVIAIQSEDGTRTLVHLFPAAS
jgi:Family of unknown function (DUF5335)